MNDFFIPDVHNIDKAFPVLSSDATAVIFSNYKFTKNITSGKAFGDSLNLLKLFKFFSESATLSYEASL